MVYSTENQLYSRRQLVAWVVLLGAVSFGVLLCFSPPLSAQGPEVSNEMISDLAAEAQRNATESRSDENSLEPTPGINILSLLIQGGWFMLPIALMSFLVVAMSFERLIGIRRGRVLPSRLRRGLIHQTQQPAALDVPKVHQLCNENPSSGARIVQGFLSKIGRPQSEIETAVAAESQRAADCLYANVRYLTLAAGVTPLLGLLGTVWGLIRAFHDTSQLEVSANRAEYLAQGIYEALVTTLAGLIVAIPAAILAHYFEGRVTAIFAEIDQLMTRLVHKSEPYEGRVRFESTENDLFERPINASSVSYSDAAMAASADSRTDPTQVRNSAAVQSNSQPPQKQE